MPQRIEISYKTIIFTVLFILGLWVLWLIREVILLLFISFILVSALHAPVDWLNRRKVPRSLAIAFIYLLIIVFILTIFGLIIPPLVEQTKILIQNFPSLLDSLNRMIAFYQIPTKELIQSAQNQIGSVGKNVFEVTAGAFSIILFFIAIFVFTFYLLLQWKFVVRFLFSPFAGKKEEEKLIKVFDKLQHSLGAWVRGQLTLSLIVGVLSFIGLTLLGIPYALPLAIFAGLFEIIPIIGPIISAIPAILAGLTVSPILALAAAALYFVIQQTENHLLVPQVMSRAVGLNPLITILALMTGAKLMGLIGALLAVPVVISVMVLAQEFLAAKGEDGT